MDKNYAQLNPQQRQAVDTIEGPLLVLAGPGTGKTQLLSARVMRVLETTDTPAKAILCLTFTDSGAENMRQRLTRFIGEAAYQVMINTYHGFAQTIINQYPEFFVDQNLKTVVDPVTEWQFIDEIKSEMAPNNILKNIDTQNILSTIHELKAALLTADDLRAIAKLNQADLAKINTHIRDLTQHIKSFRLKFDVMVKLFEDILQVLTPRELNIKNLKSVSFHAYHELQLALQQASESGSTSPLTKWRASFLPRNQDNHYALADNYNFYRLMHLAEVYEQYQQKMSASGLYDFDDMILKTIQTIENCDELRFNLQEKYLYTMLDEYQDTNRAQSRLIELLVDNPVHEGRPNIMAVGDDDQAIFAFQGADYSNMLNFYRRYRQTKLVSLNQNYRSSQEILDFSTNIAGQITDRLTNLVDDQPLTKKLIAANSTLAAPMIKRLDFSSVVAQKTWLAKTIAELLKNGESPEEIAVIATRHHTLEAVTPYFLTEQIPIRYERSRNILDNPGIQALLKIAELVQALQQFQLINHLIFEVLSYEIWGLETVDIWQVAWQNQTPASYLETILKFPDQFSAKLRPIALWLLEFAKQTNQLSLEANFDLLVGNTTLTLVDHDQTIQFASPLKQFYQQRSDEEMFDFSLSLNLLRERFIAFNQVHPKTELLPLAMLLAMVKQHQAAGLAIGLTDVYRNSQSAVSLLTAFKAKGLEFKHVFLLDVDQHEWGGSNPGRNQLSLPGNLRVIRHEKTTINEQLRLLFVAISRAKTNLYLLRSELDAKQHSRRRLEFLQEVDEGDGQYVAKAIPAAFAKVEVIDQPVEREQLELERFDNFTAWRNRHLKAALDFKTLLQPRLQHFKLSPTSFNNYLDLKYSGPTEFFLRYILGFPSSLNLHTVYGTLIHAVLDHAQKVTDWQLDHLMAFFEQKLAESRLMASERATLSDWGQKSLPVFLAKRQEIFTNDLDLRVETEVKISTTPVTADGVILSGTIDRLEINEETRTITIIDYKTGKTHSKLDLNDNLLYSYFMQLYFYKIMLEASNQYPDYQVTSWRLEFLTPTPDGQINTLSGEFNQVQEEQVNTLIRAVWRRVQTGIFTTPDLPATLAGRKQFEKALRDELS